MTSRYIPEVGDVVNYKGKRMVIIKTHLYSLVGDYTAYLLDENKLKEFISIRIETELLLSKCTKLRYDLLSPSCIPFDRIDNIPIEVKELSCIEIKI